MNWNSRDRFSASIDEHNHGNSPNSGSTSPQNKVDQTEEERPSQISPSALFDPFSTIYEWNEHLNQLEPKAKSNSKPREVNHDENDFENCESLFLGTKVAEKASFFDPLQTIMSDDDDGMGRSDDGIISDVHQPSDIDKNLSFEGDASGFFDDSCASPAKSQGNRLQLEEFVFVDNENTPPLTPPSPPPSPSNNDLNMESYCLIPNECDLQVKEPSMSDDNVTGESHFVEVFQPSDIDVKHEDSEATSSKVINQLDNGSKTSSAESLTSSAESSSSLRSPSHANSSIDSSVSCEDAYTSNSTSLASHDGFEDHTFQGLLIRDSQYLGDGSALKSDWLPAEITFQRPFQFAKKSDANISGERLEKSKEGGNSNGCASNVVHLKNHRDTQTLLCIHSANSKRSEIKLLQGLQMSETTVTLKVTNGRKKRLFTFAISKSNYTEKVYLKATNPIKNEPTCFSQNSPVSRFGNFVSGFTFGLKKLESFIPRLSLEAYNVLNHEKILEISSEDYETLRRLRNAAEDAIFYVSNEGKQGVHGCNDSKPCQHSEASSFKNNTSDDSRKYFRSSRLLRTLSQRFSQHFLSREETFEGDKEIQKCFKKEEVLLDFIDECSLDISFCNDKSASNFKIITKLFVTLFLNKPFRLTLALNDRRYDLRKSDQNIISEKNRSLLPCKNHPTSHEPFVTIKDVITCGQALTDYSERRELVMDDGDDFNVGKKFEAMRIKVFSGTELEVNNLPLNMSARLKINNGGQIKLKMIVSCRRRCQNILLRLNLPRKWLDIFQDVSIDEARMTSRRITGPGFNKLQALLGNRGITNSKVFEVSCGEAWFNDAAEELIWKIEELTDQKDAVQSNFLKINFIGCNNRNQIPDSSDNSRDPSTDYVLTNRFVKISFTVEDYNLSNVKSALVRVDRSHEVTKGSKENQKCPEVVERHATKFEYCVEMEVSEQCHH